MTPPMNQKRYTRYDLIGIAGLVFCTWLAVQTCNHKNEVVAVQDAQLSQKRDTIRILQEQATFATQKAVEAEKKVVETKQASDKKIDSALSLKSENKIESKNLFDTTKELLRQELVNVKKERDSLRNLPFKYAGDYFTLNQRRGDSVTNFRDSITYTYNAVLTPQISFRGRRFLGVPHWDTGSLKHGKNVATLTLTSPDPNLTFYPGKRQYTLALRQPNFGGALQLTMSWNPNTNSLSIGPGGRIYYKNWNGYAAYYYNVLTHKFVDYPNFSISYNLKTF